VLLARLYREYITMSGMIQRAYKYRFYPTTEQESLLRRTMGCVRLVYNKALAARTDAWYQTSERVGYEQISSMLTSWKKEQELDFQGRG
jgi:putative transposase